MSLYARLAWDGIRKNKRLYLPYILTCVGMVMTHYMMSELCASDLLRHMKGGGASHIILGWAAGSLRCSRRCFCSTPIPF